MIGLFPLALVVQMMASNFALDGELPVCESGARCVSVAGFAARHATLSRADRRVAPLPEVAIAVDAERQIALRVASPSRSRRRLPNRG